MNRCRLVVILEPEYQTEEIARLLIAGGDIASVMLIPKDTDTKSFATRAEQIIPIFQEADIATLIADDSQVAGRSGADGFFMQGDRQQYKDTIASFSPQKIAGCGNIKDRHGALEVGEMKPDFLFFGKPDGDIKPQAHPKNLALAEWWGNMVEIPGIVMSGNDIESVIECAETKIDFVAVGKAIFESGIGPQEAVTKINQLLDENAPDLEEEDA